MCSVCRHELWKFWLPREWKPPFDVANNPEIGTSSSCCCVDFFFCECGCLLSVDNQDDDVLQKFAHCLWVDRRFGPFASVLLLLFTSCLLALRLLIAYCMELAAGWFAFAWLYLCYRLWLSHSSIVVMKCFVVFIIVILSWLVTFGIALLIVLLLYNHVLLRDNRDCKSNVFNGLLKRPLDVFARGRLWTLMVGHRCNGDLNEQ